MYRRLKNLVPKPIIIFTHWLRAVIAIGIYGYPAGNLKVVGITGTDGKTTTSQILYAILRAADLPVSLITTTGAIIYGKENVPLGLHVTTPNPFELQHFLREAKRAGSEYIILEATSHGLAQYRVLGSNFNIGVLTNVTNEHLDYHGTYERYLSDKARLFKGVKTSILNRDDRSFELISKKADGKHVTYGLSPGVDLTAENISYIAGGSTFTIPAIDITVTTRFSGDYNIQNMLAAVGAAIELGISPEHIAAGLEAATPPPGRLEPIEMGQPFQVFIDFAHTSNGLDSLLKMLHQVREKRLIVVFGSAGERDPFKRYPMGVSAGKYADITVITAEDPRTENLEEIIDEIARGVESQGGLLNKTYYRVPDRTEAIAFAIQKLAQPGDIVVSTGKAHEQSMCFGTTEYPWDEFAAVRTALKTLLTAQYGDQQ